jgi:hypothetical protein
MLGEKRLDKVQSHQQLKIEVVTNIPNTLLIRGKSEQYRSNAAQQIHCYGCLSLPYSV